MTFTTGLEQEFDWSRGSGSKHELGYKFYTLFCRKQQLALLIQDPVNLLNFPSQNVNTEQLQSAVSFILTVSRIFRGCRRLLPPKMMMFLLIGVVQTFSRQVFGWLKIKIESFLEDPNHCMIRLNKILATVRPEGFTDFWLSSCRPHKPVSTQAICK